MPPRTRTRATKLLKENIENVKKSKLKLDEKRTKPPRKALADKTNSLSDDNSSIDDPARKTSTKLKSNVVKSNKHSDVRPRRERRLPSRFVENNMLKNLSNNKDSPTKQNPVSISVDISKKPITQSPTAEDDKVILNVTPKNKSVEKVRLNKSDKTSPRANKAVPIINTPPEKDGKSRPKRNCQLQSEKDLNMNDSSHNESSPFKSPQESDCSLIVNRPKRICRLPSRFEDHSVSPNKFIPVQPCHASTPILKTKTQNDKLQHGNAKKIITVIQSKDIKTTVKPKSKQLKTNARGDTSMISLDKSSPDTNNNGKKTTRAKRTNVKTKLLTKQVSPEANKITLFGKRLLDKSLSFIVLEDKKQQKDSSGLDIYEFTYDPNEEPVQKKKRKKIVKTKPSKPKPFFKSTYNDVMSKALASLKTKVKPSQTPIVQNTDIPAPENVESTVSVAKPLTEENIPQSNDNVSSHPIPVNETTKNSIHESNYASIRVEDIAADFELHHDDINYSPVNSPGRPVTPIVTDTNTSTHVTEPQRNVVKLEKELSFFDEQPVASSSMNVSAKHPMASPWRVEFYELPIKWQADTYVKPNMTPAVECSFINAEDFGKKKHVYTNIGISNEPLPEVENNTSNLKQTSILSFIKEVAERIANKRKRKRHDSPVKTNDLFDDITNTSADFGYKTPKKAKKAKDATPNTSNDKSIDKENSDQSNNKSVSPAKVQKKKDKDCTFFGFDESENVDQENVSPSKNNPNTRTTRGLRSRAVLGELNAQAGPTRAVMPVTKTKLTSSEVVNQLYEQVKSSEDASQFPGKEAAKEPVEDVVTNVQDSIQENDDDSQSVHLFEDIELIHHLKPHRKSYGKNKKVTFRQRSTSDSDSQSNPVVAEPNSSSDEDDLADLSFHLPDVKEKKVKKKKKPKKLLSKKEEKEAEEWAAGFNSMCEDVEEFPLVVE